MRKAAIIGYNRIPFTRANTAYINLGNREMLKAVLDGMVEKYSLNGALLGEVAGGAVIKHSSEGNLVRECVMETALSPCTPAIDMQQACITGLQSASYIAGKIALGQIDSGIACGVDSASNVPIAASPNLNKILLEIKRSKSITERLSSAIKLRIRDFRPDFPVIKEPKTGLSMGGHTDLTADFYQISREAQDYFALQSHLKLAKAYDEGFFSDMISPFMGVSEDNNLRRDTNMQKLSNLMPAFSRESGVTPGTLTAGNSTPLTDGASAVLLGSEDWARANGLPILAYITYAETAGIEYVKDRQNLLLAPVFSASRMLEKAGLKLQDFDFYEIHEAFAAQALSTIKIWEDAEISRCFGQDSLGRIDPAKINVKGGSLAAGHPFAATGGRILATMAKLLSEKQGPAKGFISVCAARGQGMTMILEK